MARIVGNRNLTNIQDSNADLDNLAMGSAITNTQNIDVLPQIYEPRYAPQPYNPHLGFYSNRQQTQFAPDWNYQPTNLFNRNMRDVSGEVGEYSERPGQGYNEEMYTPKSKGFNLWDFLPGKAVYEGLGAMLPKMDPRQVALRDFYGYDNVGRVPTGLMAGYNPVSGGLFGGETNYGLQRAYDKRIGTIDKTLAKWEADEEKYAEKLKTTQLYARRKALQEAKAAELAMLQKVQTGEGGTTIVPPDTGGKTGDGGVSTFAGDSGAKPGTTGSWTPAGTYTPPQGNKGGVSTAGQAVGTGRSNPSGYSSRSHSGGDYGGKYHWAKGGRVGYQNGELVEQETDFIQGPQGGEEFQETVVEGQEQPSREQLEALAMEIFQLPLEELDDQQLLVVYQEAMQGQPMEEAVQEDEVQFAAQGGLAGLL